VADNLSLELETKKFNRWARSFAKGMEREAAEKTLEKIAFDFLARVIKNTPVDTGRARGGWTSFLVAAGVGTGSVRQGAGSAFSSEEVAKGLSESFFQKNFRARKPFILLINAVQYIVALEFGHSDQAPAGMMRITFREMQAGQTLTKELRVQLREQFKKANRRAR